MVDVDVSEDVRPVETTVWEDETHLSKRVTTPESEDEDEVVYKSNRIEISIEISIRIK